MSPVRQFVGSEVARDDGRTPSYILVIGGCHVSTDFLDRSILNASASTIPNQYTGTSI